MACIIRSGPQTNAIAFAPSQVAFEQLGDDADAAQPLRAGAVDGLADLDVGAGAPAPPAPRRTGGRPGSGRRSRAGLAEPVAVGERGRR